MKAYFDNAATTPLLPEALTAMMPFLTENYGNPSSVHGFGRPVKAAIEMARKQIANGLNASTGEIFFTSGGTESNNTALKCAAMQEGFNAFITSPIEHHCVLNSLEFITQLLKVPVYYVELDELGHIDLNSLENLLKEYGKNSLVSLMHANNEIGNLIDLACVSALCKEYGAKFHTDAIQSIGQVEIDLQSVHVDFLTGSAHKFHGPKGAGFLYINADTQISPLIHGGSQERNMRAGTECPFNIVGMGVAFEHAIRGNGKKQVKLAELKNHLINGLSNSIEGVQFNGDYAGRSLNKVLNVAFPKSDRSDMLTFNLDIAGIAASGGSACSSGSQTQSHVIRALGRNPETTSIRFSFSQYNTLEEIDYLIDVLKGIYS